MTRVKTIPRSGASRPSTTICNNDYSVSGGEITFPTTYQVCCERVTRASILLEPRSTAFSEFGAIDIADLGERGAGLIQQASYLIYVHGLTSITVEISEQPR